MESPENNPKDLSFYASLRPGPFLQDQKFTTVNDTSNNDFDEVTEQRESDKENDIDDNIFFTFLDEIKADYEDSSSHLCVALNKFAERYHQAKSKSISRLSERSGGGKRKLPGASKEKENTDPYIIPS
ncbi:17799_t:CDS:2 [Gigaspora rosea]|nr:17799_t:CDS:2 [Gigaspora rosea]